MTLIASIINHNVPFILSDLLMSSLSGRDDFESPTNSFPLKPYLDNKAKYKPDSFLQKSYILRDDLCIAFSGVEDEIRNFLNEIKIRCKYYSKITIEDITRFLDNYDINNNFKNSAFVLVLITEISPDTKNVKVLNLPNLITPWRSKKGSENSWAHVKNPIYGDVWAFGSGSNRFLNIIEEADLSITSKFKNEDIWLSIQKNIVLIARTLALEKATLYTILTHWGGGFEMVMYDGQKFIKLQDISFVLNQGKFDENGDVNLPLPTTILYYRYQDDFLIITRIYLKNLFLIEDGELIKLISDKTNYEIKNEIIPRFDNENSITDFTEFNFDFNTIKVAMGYDIRKNGSEGTFNPGTFTYHNEITVSYKTNENVEIIIAKEINNEFRRQAKNVYPNI